VCYEALYDNAGDSVNNVPAIGLPQIILERSGKFRMAKPDETMGYMEEVKIDGDG
jgi:hypothetical protein